MSEREKLYEKLKKDFEKKSGGLIYASDPKKEHDVGLKYSTLYEKKSRIYDEEKKAKRYGGLQHLPQPKINFGNKFKEKAKKKHKGK